MARQPRSASEISAIPIPSSSSACAVAQEAGVLFVAMKRRRAFLGLAALQALVFWLLVDLAAAGTIAGGTAHMLVIRTTDGTVWAWGQNTGGQLGDGTTTQRKTPTQVSGLSGVVAVAAGAIHSLALTSTGVLYAWGDNTTYGQIGNGNNTDQKLPVEVMTGVAQVAAGDYHSIALKTDGTLHVWGRNSEGQLADGGTTHRNTPYQVTGLGLINAIAGGGNHTLVVLAAGGSLKAWGKNTNGQLGDGLTYNQATSPVAVSTVLNATNVAGGYAFSFARLFDGTLYSWGHNLYGQLGLGDMTQRPTPTPLTAPTSVAAVATGGYHALALLSDGSLAAWGYNSYGSVGDGSATQRTSPVPVTGLPSVAAIGAGQYHSVAVTSSGEVWSWGYNNYSQLGDGTNVARFSPIKIAEAGFNWKAATPTFSPAPNTYTTNKSVTIACATTGATIRYTTDGMDPTDSSTVYSSAVSITVSTILKAKAFATGLAESNTNQGLYALKVVTPAVSPGTATYTTPQTVTITTTTTGATIRFTTDGSEPTPESTPYTAPVSVPTTTTLKAAGFKDGWTTSDTRTATYTMNFGTLAAPTFNPAPAGYTDSVTLTIDAATGATIRYTIDGSTPGLTSALYAAPLNLLETTTVNAKAWKADYTASAVASGIYTLKVAAPLLSLAPGTYPAGTAVTLTAATAGASLRYTLDGSDPTETDPSVPSVGSIVLGNYTLKVRSFKTGCDPSDVVTATYSVSGDLSPGMVSAGEGFSLAVLSDGTAWSWGSSAHGKLGIGPKSGSQFVPAPIESLTGVVAIAAADDHALALTAGGAVWSWGANASGQLGIGTTVAVNTPQPVAALSGVVAVAAGGVFSAALKSDGTLWVWGENADGQLGLDDTVDRLLPTQVLTGVAQVALGRTHVVVSKTDGTAWTWGANASGQLGDGTTTPRGVPAPVNGLTAPEHVAAGANWTMVRADGVAHAWGENGLGQLGDGSQTDRLTPTALPSLEGTVAFDGGIGHSLARASDGTAMSWGANGQGQLGDGTTGAPHPTPATIPGLTSVVSISAGEEHSLAIASDGSIWAWGWNYYGRLGDGTSAQRTSPVKVRDGALWKVGTPTMSPVGGNKTAVQTVTISVATPGATVRYTTTGLDPVVGDPEIAAGGTVMVDRSLTLKAIALKPGMADSNAAAEVYSLTVATPTISPAGTIFYEPLLATITCSVSGATIRYTTNGLDPTPSDPVIASGGTVAIDVTQTLKAKAWLGGWAESVVASRTFSMVVATPTLSPGGGSYGSGLSVTVSTTTPDAELHYTTNGLEPAPGDLGVTSGNSLGVGGSLTLKVKGWRAGWTASGTAAASYFVLEGTVTAPAFDPLPGTFTQAQSVALTSATPGAAIRYTLDGTTPGTDSPLYAGPVAVSATTTLSARAFKIGWSPSGATTGTYVLDTGVAASPTITPPGGVIAAGRLARVFSAELGATLRYTTTGIDPSEEDPVVASGGLVPVSRSMQLKVRAWKAGVTPSPVVSADFDVVGAVAAGTHYTVVLRSDGTLTAWGDNYDGQLGDGTTTERRQPVAVQGITDVVAIAAGQTHTLALKQDRTVWAWGEGVQGQLGDGAGTQSSRPTQVSHSTGPLTDVVAIAAGGAHSLALTSDGTVWAWGYGYWGAMGDGGQAGRDLAAPVPGLSGVTAISAGGEQCLALQTNGATHGNLWAWGRNQHGQLGDGSTTNRLTPVKVAEQVEDVQAGVYHTLLRKVGGGVWAAGLNEQSQLGDGTAETPRLTFVPALIGVPDVAKLAPGGVHSLALTAEREVWATGYNNLGQLGEGTKLAHSLPVQTAVLRDVVDVAASHFPPNSYVSTNTHSVALTADGRVWTWGANGHGELGTGGDISDALVVPRPVDGVIVSDQTWPLGDPDGDGLVTQEELQAGSDPFHADTNGDGISDLVAVRSGLSTTNPDVDGDGVANVVERAQGTDPLRADSDADGTADDTDCFPLDPTRSVCPVPQPGDVTPPVVTLSEPTSAVLVGSVP